MNYSKTPCWCCDRLLKTFVPRVGSRRHGWKSRFGIRKRVRWAEDVEGVGNGEGLLGDLEERRGLSQWGSGEEPQSKAISKRHRMSLVWMCVVNWRPVRRRSLIENHSIWSSIEGICPFPHGSVLVRTIVSDTTASKWCIYWEYRPETMYATVLRPST